MSAQTDAPSPSPGDDPPGDDSIDDLAPVAASHGYAGVLLRAAITVAILVFLFVRFDVATSLELITSNFVPLLIVGTGLVFVSLILNAWRWYLLIPVTGAMLAFRTTTALTLLGHFFNQLLPTSVGGDVVRGWEAHRSGLRLDQAVISVVLDRIMGLTGLLLLIIAGQPLLIQRVSYPGFTLMALALIACGIGGLVLMFVFYRLPLPFERFRILRAGRELSVTARRLARSRGTAAITLLISVGVHTSALLLATVYARGFGLDVSFIDMALVVPTVLLVSSLPLSIGGWGIREAGLAAGFAVLGYPAGIAVTVSILIGLTNLAWALPGAVIWVMRRRRAKSVRRPG